MTPQQFAALHTRMRQQLAARKATNTPLGPGDLVQAHPGGEIREIVTIVSAGVWLEQHADTLIWHMGSTAEQCAVWEQDEGDDDTFPQ